MKLTKDHTRIAQPSPLDEIHRMEDEIEEREEDLFSEMEDENIHLKERLKIGRDAAGQPFTLVTADNQLIHVTAESAQDALFKTPDVEEMPAWAVLPGQVSSLVSEGQIEQFYQDHYWEGDWPE